MVSPDKSLRFKLEVLYVNRAKTEAILLRKMKMAI